MTRYTRVMPVFLPFHPARFHDLPTVEDLAPSVTPGHLALSLTNGEDVNVPPLSAVLYEGPDGVPVAVEVGGEAYRLPAALAPLFALALNSPAHVEAAHHARTAYVRLSRWLEDPYGAAPHVFDAVREDLAKAADAWPAPTRTPGEEEDPPRYAAPDARNL